jgi:hypothetical protein
MLGWLVLLALSGCGGGVTVHGEMLTPARVPVRAFPRILVTANDDPESQGIADAVAGHLEVGRSEVGRTSRGAVRTMRARGRIERATAVVDLRITMVETGRPEWTRRSDVECGPLGCFESRRAVIQDVPLVRAHLAVSVADGPSGRSLQRIEITEEEASADVLAVRLRVLERLRARALALVDQRMQEVPVELYPIDQRAVGAAVELARAGRFGEARERLMRFVEGPRFAALARRERAIVLYDLGQVLRFDRTVEAELRFDRAERAFERAVLLSPEPLFARALRDLEIQRRSREMVREQDEAMAHNFGLSRTAPPRSYRD